MNLGSGSNAAWLVLALWSIPLYAVAFLAVAFFGRNFQFGGLQYMFWSFLGSTVACGVYLLAKGQSPVPERGYLAPLVFCIGATVVFTANACLYRAMASNPPNPALPPTIMSANVVVVFLLARILAKLLPAYFAAEEFCVQKFAGILCFVAGFYLIRRP